MKNASAELISLLNTSDNLKVADLYTFTLTNGTVLRYTSADFDVEYNGNTYLCENAGIKRSSMSWQTGLSVDSLDLEFYPKDTDLVGTLPLVQAFRNGTFDGASLQLDMAFFENWTDTPLVLEKLFLGNVDVDEIGGNNVKVEVKSITEILNTKIPRNIYQSACAYTLYGAGCGVNKATFSSNASVLVNTTKTVIKCSLAQSVGYFDQGVILFTSGQNLNVKRSIKAHTSGQLTLNYPLQYTPEIGDTFTVSAGCDRTMNSCKNKFNNLANFPETPFIPNPDKTL
jgi:uncharacterized phage protein (TIGR02218 family)